jgi:hypothetical protein
VVVELLVLALAVVALKGNCRTFSRKHGERTTKTLERATLGCRAPGKWRWRIGDGKEGGGGVAGPMS